ncbi:TetR/AcrR family transcriptional regulator [Amycolatopsis sp. NPDC059657]|uniref:TetR/AcrR family transcriptional regulator n=1 Tax=Amycolatopsis sp. NPDC059657 TaxID=3346899 RepID=UPI00367163EE
MANRGEARDLLVTTAAELIYRRGVGASGVDTITRESGVSKPTLYAHFRSKGDLVEAALEWRHERRRRELTAYLDEIGGSGIDRVLAVFDWVAEVNLASGLRGCAFLNAAVELVEDADAPALEVVRRHKTWWRGIFTGLLAESAVSGREELADELMLLLDGAFARVLVTKGVEPVRAARRLAELAIAARTGL